MFWENCIGCFDDSSKRVPHQTHEQSLGFLLLYIRLPSMILLEAGRPLLETVVHYRTAPKKSSADMCRLHLNTLYVLTSKPNSKDYEYNLQSIVGCLKWEYLLPKTSMRIIDEKLHENWTLERRDAKLRAMQAGPGDEPLPSL